MTQRKEGETAIQLAERMQRLGEFGMYAEIVGWKPEEHGLGQPGRVCTEVPCQVCAAALVLVRRWMYDAALTGAQGNAQLAERAIADVPEDLVLSNPGGAIGDAMARGVARLMASVTFGFPGEYTIAAFKAVVEDEEAPPLESGNQQI